ncbi:preprotein translocase subunit YajC [Cohnella fermenti]|uniref:Preprotein translocase subunit YajC n=1 Tax=Cohnella fermenti TaxID=2565925 RepID=A0A4S4C8Y0_9BACL|nr:preprotein translocase subunit YajC [Cohnella fermenti]THF83825.1 preprotein translocase subunit YajC [Cohnella fermenti]
MTALLPFVLMFVIFYFLLIRPQQKKSKTRNAMLRAIKKGDKITTIGGLHGTIAEITDDTVVLKVNDVTKLTFDRSAINNVVEASPVKLEKAEKVEATTEASAES